MNRRDFLKGLTGCLVVAAAPTIFIPKIEPVRFKVPRHPLLVAIDDHHKFESLLADHYRHAQARLWRQMAEVSEQRADIFASLEGSGRFALIRHKVTYKEALSPSLITFGK